MPIVLVLTGTCGSGKTTVSTLLARRADWSRVCEDDIWRAQVGKDRGAFGSAEHRAKRARMQAEVLAACRAALAEGRNVVVDATVHESPPESHDAYVEAFAALGIEWTLRVLNPRLEVAVERDARRATGSLGARRVADLRAKFTGAVFGHTRFLDMSDETPGESVERVLSAIASGPGPA